MSPPKSPYFIKKIPKLPSLKEINQSKANDICCSDCVKFWDKVQAQEPYYEEQLKVKQAEEKEFDALQKKLVKEHPDYQISRMDRTQTKCRCGHKYLDHNNPSQGWRKIYHSACNTCECNNFVDHKSSKNQRLRIEQPVIISKIRKGILALFNDPNYCLSDPNFSSSSTNQHKFSATSDIHYSDGRTRMNPSRWCIHCRCYLDDLIDDGLLFNEKLSKQSYKNKFAMVDWDSMRTLKK